jgi:geranylgeranyl pyrophosphate synthase
VTQGASTIHEPAGTFQVPDPPNRVPPSREERDRLRQAVRDYAAAANLAPPLSIGELRDHARRLARSSRTSPVCADFLMVLLNNEAWKERLAAIPYGRRLLLLPQCLRRKEFCRGEFDEWGLLCRQCGRCAIANLQTEAERLGYSVLIAEGTAAVVKLIDAGKIDAVVGVSCLSVLERTFARMGAAAVPGLAIPLLWNGCSETAVDEDWVREAIHLNGTGKRPMLNAEDLKREVEAWFAPPALEALLGPAATRTEQIGREWLMRSGKRWRPFLLAGTWRSLCAAPAAAPDDLRKLALAVECFHKASLVHDDIEDGDSARYGLKTLHVEYGLPIALNVGDWLLGRGYRLIGEIGIPPERRDSMFRVAAAGHHDLCIGQGRELCWAHDPQPLSVAELLDIFRDKTAPAFRVALRLGAIYAGEDGRVGHVLDAFSDHLGIAYQIRDDLNDFRDPASGRLNPLLPSLPMAIAYENSNGHFRDLVDSVWRRRRSFDEAQDVLRSLMTELNVGDRMLRMLASCEEKAIQSLPPLPSPDLKCLLRRVIEKIFGAV